MIRTRHSWEVVMTCLLLASFVAIRASALDAEKPKVELVEKSAEHPAEFHISGVPDSQLKRLKDLDPTDSAFGEILTVRVFNKTAKGELPPLAGRCRVQGSLLILTPRYPPVAGVTYQVSVQRAQGEKFSSEVTVPKPSGQGLEPAKVEQIYPSAETLPENHLRFYIHFSQPMSKGEAYEHLALLDAKGQPITAALLELGEELWDPSGMRFTLLLDPGRIKRGLRPREELGPILESGKRYTLLVKGAWPDARGRPLGQDFRKDFTAGPAVELALNPATWKLTVPTGNTANLLVVQFPHSLDHALLERTLSVLDPAGESLGGRVTVAKLEQGWSFFPRHNWKPGTYQLVVDTVLEDTAGNRIGRAFEVDEQETITRKIVTESVKIPFEIQSRTINGRLR